MLKYRNHDDQFIELRPRRLDRDDDRLPLHAFAPRLTVADLARRDQAICALELLRLNEQS